MSFNFAQLPFYAPKAPLVQPSDFSVEDQSVHEYLLDHISENNHHLKEVVLPVEFLHPDLEGWIQRLGIGNIIVEQKGVRVAQWCVTPIGLVHLTIESSTPKELGQEMIDRLSPDTVSVRYPNREQWEELQQEGFVLRTEMVRWFAHVPPFDKPFEHLTTKAASYYRRQLRKSEGLILDVQPLSVENVQEWIPVYEREVVARSNGVFVFYPRVWLRGEKLKDNFIVRVLDEKGVYMGGAIINTWGGFGDIENSTRKYTTLQMVAVDSHIRDRAAGFLLAREGARIANEQGDKVYSYGADFDFWGTDINSGLHRYKTSLGMCPLPELAVEAFRAYPTDRRKKQSTETFCLSLKDDSSFVRTYFEKNSGGWSGQAQELFDRPWEIPEVLEHMQTVWKRVDW